MPAHNRNRVALRGAYNDAGKDRTQCAGHRSGASISLALPTLGRMRMPCRYDILAPAESTAIPENGSGSYTKQGFFQFGESLSAKELENEEEAILNQ